MRAKGKKGRLTHNARPPEDVQSNCKYGNLRHAPEQAVS